VKKRLAVCLLHNIGIAVVSECSSVGGGCAGGASAPLKVLICWKFRQNPWKFGQNLWKFGKIPENPNKIPKYLGKIPENLGKNGAQRCLTLNNGAQGLQKNRWRPFFWRSHLGLPDGRYFTGLAGISLLI